MLPINKTLSKPKKIFKTSSLDGAKMDEDQAAANRCDVVVNSFSFESFRDALDYLQDKNLRILVKDNILNCKQVVRHIIDAMKLQPTGGPIPPVPESVKSYHDGISVYEKNNLAWSEFIKKIQTKSLEIRKISDYDKTNKNYLIVEEADSGETSIFIDKDNTAKTLADLISLQKQSDGSQGQKVVARYLSRFDKLWQKDSIAITVYNNSVTNQAKQSALDQVKSKSKVSLKKYKDMIGSYESRLNNLQAANIDLIRKLNDRFKSESSLRKAVRRKIKDKLHLNDMHNVDLVKNLKTEVSHLKKNISSNEGTIQELTSKLKEDSNQKQLRAMIKDLKLTNKELEKQYIDSKAALAEEQKVRKTNEEELAKHKALKSKLVNKLKQQKSKYGQFKKSVSLQQIEKLERINSENNKLQGTIAQLQGLLNDNEQKRISLAIHNQALTEEVGKLEGKLSQFASPRTAKTQIREAAKAAVDKIPRGRRLKKITQSIPQVSSRVANHPGYSRRNIVFSPRIS